MGSVVVAHGLSCSTACGIFPGRGLEPVSPALAGGFLTTAPPGKSNIVEYYPALKKSEILIQATIWMKLENIMASERSQS